MKPSANIGILSLFPDKDASVAIVKHSLLLGMLTTDYLSPELEQLSYATRKHIQWKWNEDVGEDKYVLVSEALHVEFVGEAIEGIISGAGF